MNKKLLLILSLSATLCPITIDASDHKSKKEKKQKNSKKDKKDKKNNKVKHNSDKKPIAENFKDFPSKKEIRLNKKNRTLPQPNNNNHKDLKKIEIPEQDSDDCNTEIKETIDGASFRILQGETENITALHIIQEYAQRESLSEYEYSRIFHYLNANIQSHDNLNDQEMAYKAIQDFNDEKDNEFFIQEHESSYSGKKTSSESNSENNQPTEKKRNFYIAYTPHFVIAVTTIALVYHYREPLKKNLTMLKEMLLKRFSF